MSESHSGERSVVPQEPTLADYDPLVRVMRTVAVLGMILGCAGVVSLPFGLLRLHQGSFAGDLRLHLFNPQIEDPSRQAMWMFFSSAVGTGLAAMLMLGSIAAMSFRPVARPILLLWAISSLTMGLGGSYFYVRWLLPPWREESAQVRGVVDSLVNFGGWGIGTTLGVVMLYLLTRPRIKDAFRRGGSV
jgi:hypothetical protein